MRRRAPALLLAACAVACSHRDAVLPGESTAARGDLLTLTPVAGGAALRATGQGHGWLYWEGGDWAMHPGFPVEIVRTDNAFRRQISGPPPDATVFDFRLVGDRVVFRTLLPGGHATNEVWSFDPATTRARRLPTFGADVLFRRPGHDTLIVRGWSRPTGGPPRPDVLKEIDPVSGSGRRLAHPEGHTFYDLSFDADGGWYFVRPLGLGGGVGLTAVSLESGAVVTVEPGAVNDIHPIQGGVAIEDGEGVRLFRPPDGPVRLYEPRSGDSVLDVLPVLAGTALVVAVGLPEWELTDDLPDDRRGMAIDLVDTWTGRVERISDGHGLRRPSHVSPDGRWLIERRSPTRGEQSRSFLWLHDLHAPSRPARRVSEWPRDLRGFSADSRAVLLGAGELLELENLELLAQEGPEETLYVGAPTP